MSRTRIIKDYVVTKGAANTLRVKLCYEMGGHSWFTGQKTERGLYLSVTPLTISKSECGTYNSVQYNGFSGTKMLVKPMSRFSQKVLDTFEVDADIQNRLTEHVRIENSIEIAE